ncbi:MAG: hypothetical protein LBI79_11040 [Nitrososphaerota archaeon]|jgi:hypothetical protein|nr:hypothetical protein [Nitrososphaerota archaeon]
MTIWDEMNSIDIGDWLKRYKLIESLIATPSYQEEIAKKFQRPVHWSHAFTTLKGWLETEIIDFEEEEKSCSDKINDLLKKRFAIFGKPAYVANEGVKKWHYIIRSAISELDKQQLECAKFWIITYSLLIALTNNRIVIKRCHNNKTVGNV